MPTLSVRSLPTCLQLWGLLKASRCYLLKFQIKNRIASVRAVGHAGSIVSHRLHSVQPWPGRVGPSASLVHQQPQAMALWTSLLAGSVVALALVVAWLLLQGHAKNSKLKAIPAPPKTHWLLGHPGVIDQ